MKERIKSSLVTGFLLLVVSSALCAAPTKVLFVSSLHSNKAKVAVLKKLVKNKGVQIDQKSDGSFKGISEATELFRRYQLIVLDGASINETEKTFAKYQSFIKQSSKKFLAIKWPSSEIYNKGMPNQQAQTLHAYYDNGGQKNLSRMADYLAWHVFGDATQEVSEPIVYPEVGIYHPQYENLIFNSLDDYLNWRGYEAHDVKRTQKAVVGVMLQRSLIESVQTDVIDRTIKSLEQKGVLAVPCFFELSRQSSEYKYLLQSEGRVFIDLIINFRVIHWANQRKAEFESIGVPVVQALAYYDGDQKHWEESAQGISPGMTPFVLVLPEMAGVIDPVMVAAMDEKSDRLKTIDYQLEFLINKALNIISLKNKPNAEKRLTVMIWGDRDVGASFLNVPESIRAISHHLNQKGYAVQASDSDFITERIHQILNPFYRDYELQALLDEDLAELMPLDVYWQWFKTLPAAIKQPVMDYWGDPENNFMVVERDGYKQFVIPRIRNGNMLIMRQPPRADDKDEDKRLYHKGEVPINHYYLAAYYYARQYWASDALIHLGTHGSQEWLYGKERGLSRYDDGNLSVWETPVFYPFIVDDVGEAMQTKRRGSAVVISHMTPPFAAAGLQGKLSDIHELMHQYKSLDEGGVKAKTAQQIKDECIQEKICEDLGFSEAKIDMNFPMFLDALHDYLEELAATNQPLGLHSFGELSEQRLITSTIVQMLGQDFIQRAARFEAKRYGSVVRRHDHSHNSKAHTHEHHVHESQDKLEGLAGYKTVRDYVIASGSLKEVDKHLHKDIERGKIYYKNTLAIQELESLSAGLEGKYIKVKTGGDPIRSPASLPTGTNLYGFDPARLPAKAAYEQGKELVEDVIAQYYSKHGRYPDKLAFSLWSIEAMRHYGVLESQVLYAMGVKPKWSPAGRVVGTEIIPASELKRPRIDVVLSITGLYRDAFPNVVLRLSKAIQQVTKLKEANNSLWDNSLRIQQDLIDMGIKPDEAEYLSSVRIFSSASGQYGTGVDDAAFASDTWEKDSMIADLYLSKMGYAYGADDKRWGEDAEHAKLYAKQLSGTDVAMLSRSSNIYGMISTDDPFEFFGAISLAVRNLDGKSPEMMISNLRNATKGKVVSADLFLSKELRTRVFHKRWIEEMRKEGYSGAVAIADRVSNFWGWQVVDPNIVRGDQWQEFFEVYIQDKLELNIPEWFEKVNPASQALMIERMLEAIRKDYWQADEATQQRLVERFVELVEKYDLFVDNEKLREFVDQTAAGFGLNMALPPLVEAAPTLSAAQQVEGQQLEKVQPSEHVFNWNIPLLAALLLSFFVFLSGVWRQIKPPQAVALR